MAYNGQNDDDESRESERNWHSGKLYDVRDRNLDLSRRGALATAGAGILAGLTASTGSVGAATDGEYHLKTRPTLFTEEMRRNARRNVERYEWAENQRDTAVDSAEGQLDRYGPELDSLWRLITSQKVPRGGGRSFEREILGGISEPGTERPWKIETTVDNPHGEGKLTVPTNDFEAYRRSGLDDRGMFDPELADDSLLVNEEHPEMGEGWGVDDGWGWVDENDDLGAGAGNRWNFVAFYNHWFVWRPGGIRRTLVALTDAYLLTGEPKYAVAGLVMLDRIADVYPEMSIWEYKESDGFWNNHGGRQTGRIIGGSWETNLVRNLMPAYDAFFPALDDEDVRDEVVAFLQAKAAEFPALDDKDSAATIRENIEENFIQEMLPAAKESDLVPSRGQRPSVALSARIQDDVREDGYTRQALEWLFQPGGEQFVGDVWNEEPENWITTGGELLVPVIDQCDRDGYWHEAATGYNRIQMEAIRQVAETLKGYDGFEGADLYQHPKFRNALKQNSDLLLLDRYSPEIGDSHSPSGATWSQSAIEDGFEVTGDSIYAQLWHYSNGYSTAGIRGSIYDAEPEGLSDEIQEIIDAEGPLDLPSQNKAGYGFTALRDGENYLNRSFGTTLDTSDLFAEASTAIDDSFDDAIQLEATGAGEWWEFEFDVDEAGKCELEFEALFTGSYGIYELFVNGDHVDTVDFMADGSGRDTLSYDLTLPSGANTIRWENVGKNDDSSNYKMALYFLTLLDEEDKEVREGIDDLGNAKRAFWMYYGRNGIGGGGTTHGHRDTLNVGVAAHELELSPDLGYPEETGSWPKRSNWTDNTISHNTVTVDESGQNHLWAGTPRHFDGSDDRVNLIDVEAPHAYEQVDDYRRTLASITVDDEHSYAVDFFRVTGGDDHVFSFHGQKGEATAEGVDLVAQGGGTYAGENVPKPGRGEDSEYNREVGSGFNYLTNVERDSDPGEWAAIDWDIEDHWNHRDDDADGVHMRLTAVGDFDEVALADGHPPQIDDNPESLRYALLRRQGTDLETDFVSTIEHYEEERVVESVDEVDVSGSSGRAIKVELKTGRTDYVVCTFDANETVTVDDTFVFKGFFGVYSIENGTPEYAYVHDGKLLRPLDGQPLIEESIGEVHGYVEDFTRGISLENEITVAITDRRDQFDRHAGFVYVDNDDSNSWRGNPDPSDPIEGRDQRGRGNGAYPIEEIISGKGNRMTIDVGDKTFTRDFVDPDRLEEAGYNYVIDEDDDIRIPLTSVWSAE